MYERAAIVGLVLLLVPIPLCLIFAILRGYTIHLSLTRRRDGDGD